MKKTAFGIKLQNNPQTREEIFWIVMDFHGVIGVESPYSRLLIIAQSNVFILLQKIPVNG